MKLGKTLIASPLSLLLLCGCSSGADSKKDTANEQEELPLVKVETVYEKEVDNLATYTATTEADKINNISSSAPLRIKSILVDEGQWVGQGQKVVVLDDVNATTYQLQVANAEASLKNIQTEYNRALELFNIGGGTKQAVDQMETQLINARNAVANAKRALRNAQENTVLTSPVNGVVTARNYDPGDMTGALPVLTVAQVQPVKILINVSESEYSLIHKGMNASVKFDTYGEEEFIGTVSKIMPTVDSQTRTFGVEITVANPNNRILPGMFARVTLNLGTALHVVVPDRAIVKQQGSGDRYVYVYSNGTVSFHKVELGRRIGSDYELLSGVESGAQVVISGQNALADGKKVKLMK